MLPTVRAYDLEGFLLGKKSQPSETLSDSTKPDFFISID